MFLLFWGVGKESLAFSVCTAAGQNSSFWDIYLSKRKTGNSPRLLRSPNPIHSHLTLHLRSQGDHPEVLRYRSRSPSITATRVSVWMSISELLCSDSLLLAWNVCLLSHRNQMKSTVTFLYCVYLLWHTWLFCKDMKSLLSSQLMNLVLDALSSIGPVTFGFFFLI